MDTSLFKSLSDSHPEAVVTLNYQYRMNMDIMSLSNRLVYKHQMKCGNDVIANAKLDLCRFGQVEMDSSMCLFICLFCLWNSSEMSVASLNSFLSKI